MLRFLLTVVHSTADLSLVNLAIGMVTCFITMFYDLMHYGMPKSTGGTELLAHQGHQQQEQPHVHHLYAHTHPSMAMGY